MQLSETQSRLITMHRCTVVDFGHPVGEMFVLTEQRMADLIERAHEAGHNEGMQEALNLLDRSLYATGKWPHEPATVTE